MRMLQKILTIILFPVHWFWNKYEEYIEEDSIIKIIMLFLLSLSGVIVIGIALICSIAYVLQYYPEFIVVGGVIVWLYAYIYNKMKQKAEVSAMQNAEQEMMLTQQQMQMQDQAIRAYPVIRNILFQSLKEMAESIGGVVPRLLAEIEVPERHYIFANNICFYQFKLLKADINMNYTQDELQEFVRILQTTISHKIQCGAFPTLGIGTCIDANGVFDICCIETIEDVEAYFIIQAVFYSPAYADYMRQKQLNLQGLSTDTMIPDETWRNTP